MAAAAIPRALTLTRTRLRRAGDEAAERAGERGR